MIFFRSQKCLAIRRDINKVASFAAQRWILGKGGWLVFFFSLSLTAPRMDHILTLSWAMLQVEHTLHSSRRLLHQSFRERSSRQLQ